MMFCMFGLAVNYCDFVKDTRNRTSTKLQCAKCKPTVITNMNERCFLLLPEKGRGIWFGSVVPLKLCSTFGQYVFYFCVFILQKVN
jgi:hypothetical protein